MKETRAFLICGIALLVVACGGGGGGGANIGASSTGQASDGVVGIALQTASQTASQTATGNGPPSSQSNIPWLFNKSTARLNKSPSTANNALNALPGNYYNGRNALSAEASKSSPNAGLYLNYGSIFGKNEGKVRSPNGEDHHPGTWILGGSCYVRVGRCELTSDENDAHHVIDADGRLNPHFIGWYDRDGNTRRGATCNGTNDYVCEVKHDSSIAVGMPNWGGTNVLPIMTANGIDMVQTSGSRADRVSGAPFDFVGYGAWMEYSGFFAEGYLYDTADGRKQENTAWTFGVVTGLPSVTSGQTLTWNGTMAGMKGSQAERQLGDPYVEQDFEAVQGDAMVTVHNDGDLQIMVALTDIFYLNPAESGSILDIVWDSDIVVSTTKPGRFSSCCYNSNQVTDMNAAFYGPNQEEVAGTFDWEDGDDFIVGAFGAKRTTQ